MKLKRKIVAIVGPTSSGKSALALKVAKQFHGEVISADSRQIYKGLDVLTGKTTAEQWDGIPHHLTDILEIGEEFSVAKFQELAYQAIDGMSALPIIAGGTGLYVSAVTEGYVLDDSPIDYKLRNRLNKMNIGELKARLFRLDANPDVDLNNPRRMVRAIEKLMAGRNVSRKKNPRYRVLKLGIEIDPETLKGKISDRIMNIPVATILEESEKVAGIQKANNPLSLYMDAIRGFKKDEISEKEMREMMINTEWQYVKRQLTWFKKDKNIYWIKDELSAIEAVKQFLV
ncbi:MAG: tRNA (adenosine(37)-N6)-dimethylallyltransferase MiaA [Patescibacteria group bacterium]